jgi:CDP-paratose 2-epimerase
MQELEHIIGSKPLWRHIAPRESDQRVFIADLSKIQSFVEWRPLVSKSDGIRRMVEWVESCAKFKGN